MEKQFFEAFGIEPTMLCNCSYKNLQEYRYEYGDDVCEHIDDFEFSCKDCEKSKKSIPYYPPITPEIVLGLFKIILDSGKDLLFTRDTDNRYLVRKNVIMRELDWHSGNSINDIILSFCIEYKDELFEDVRALFND